ncbi:MAG TPA: acyl-CoA thioester hydrolase/BAAT C-terminal domain-containing protein [Gaiellaceae bacterium]
MAGTRVAVLAVALLFAAGCGATGATINVEPHISAADEQVRIAASHLPKHAAVSARVSATDAANVAWAAVVNLRTGADGTVRVPARAIADMQPVGSSAAFFAWPSTGTVRFHVSVSGGGANARAVFDRSRLAQPVVERPVTLARDGVAGRFFAPAHPARDVPALLLFGGSEGGLAPYGLAIARTIASHGIDVLDIAYWRYPGLPPSLDRIPLEYFARGLRLLARHPGVDPRHVDVEGISYGSEAALLLGVHYPSLVHGVVASVPSNLATECYGGRCNGIDPAWTYGGRDIPAFSPIPVERIPGRIFAICGTKDLIWPSCPQAQAIVARRRAHHVRPIDVLVVARGAGHYVGSWIPYGIYRHDPGDLQFAGDEAGAELVWPRLLAFLRG